MRHCGVEWRGRRLRFWFSFWFWSWVWIWIGFYIGHWARFFFLVIGERHIHDTFAGAFKRPLGP